MSICYNFNFYFWCSLGVGEKLGLIILLLLLHFGEVLFDLASERREVVDYNI